LMMIILSDFSRTGGFGEIRIGVSRRDVRRCFGAPDDFLNPLFAEICRPRYNIPQAYVF
jgi:hypothetical protein